MATRTEGPVAFVAGATGYTGREVVRALAARGVVAVAHVRPDSPALEQWRRRFAELGARIDTTPWQPDAMAATLAALRPTYVFALLGTTRARAAAAARAGQAPADYGAVDYGLTVLLLRAAAALAPPPRFIYLSAVGASASAGSAYMRARGRVEAELAGSGMPYLAFRPGFISGPDREEWRPAERILASFTDVGMRLLGALGARRLSARFRSRTGQELAESMVRRALEPGPSRILEGEGI